MKSNFSFIGNCVNILDCPNSPYDNATEMEQDIERGESLSTNEFFTLVGSNYPADLKITKNFYFGKTELGIVYAYDENDDIHYFFL